MVPYARVEAQAREARVSVRGGCFCNPGAAEHAFGLVDVRRGVDVVAAWRDQNFTAKAT